MKPNNAKATQQKAATLDLDLALRAERKLQRHGMTLNAVLAQILAVRGLPKWLAGIPLPRRKMLRCPQCE